MLNKLSLSIAGTFTALSVGTMAQAGVIVQPTGVSTSMGSQSVFAIGNTINQIGLSQTYISGVDDFDTYLGLNPTHLVTTSFPTIWIGDNDNTTGTITFDLGNIITTTRLALWDGSSASQDITAFEVYSDDDGDFGNGGTTLLGSFNPTPMDVSPSSAQVFDFTDATTQFIHFNVTANGGSTSATRLGEVAFEQGEVTPPPSTPEPSSLTGLAFIGGGLLLRKRIRG